jgi:hypothetical protein
MVNLIKKKFYKNKNNDHSLIMTDGRLFVVIDKGKVKIMENKVKISMREGRLK